MWLQGELTVPSQKTLTVPTLHAERCLPMMYMYYTFYFCLCPFFPTKQATNFSHQCFSYGFVMVIFVTQKEGEKVK